MQLRPRQRLLALAWNSSTSVRTAPIPDDVFFLRLRRRGEGQQRLMPWAGAAGARRMPARRFVRPDSKHLSREEIGERSLRGRSDQSFIFGLASAAAAQSDPSASRRSCSVAMRQIRLRNLDASSTVAPAGWRAVATRRSTFAEIRHRYARADGCRWIAAYTSRLAVEDRGDRKPAPARHRHDNQTGVLRRGRAAPSALSSNFNRGVAGGRRAAKRRDRRPSRLRPASSPGPGGGLPALFLCSASATGPDGALYRCRGHLKLNGRPIGQIVATPSREQSANSRPFFQADKLSGRQVDQSLRK